ncbi:hypothetical protein N7466_011124 [Penicillium verhagenii]|uniref:uncharacterized protein n=1 Tax=Penicillium verhagenii TaxID=1562060 RepID=UPI002545571D|nr:uncharacterized protein N7466_011109 [Penicillium verhagenii]XP_057016245.1 uncharacterized protein N7466_011124 [Penicillium verhagenii]KAJ5917555.1 hypothetical protein N7466_011109 [Penicillium verhagenii]KAJ5917570.1 hypothetical protein N7466_011124 [Penicillium verhagenii]
MATPNHVQPSSADGSEFGSFYQPSENGDPFSVPMDQDPEHWPPIQEVVRHDQDEPENPPAADILRLYSTLWESYSMKQAEFHHLKKENDMLRAANLHLCQQMQISDRQFASQQALLAHSEQGFGSFRKGVRALLEGWDGCPKSK